MRKQLLVSFLCCLLASATSLAQNWKSYEKIAKGKTYETSECVTLLDSTLVSVQPTGQGSFAVCKVIKVQTPKGAVDNRVIKYDYDPLTAYAEFKHVTIYRANGKIDELDVKGTCDYAAPARAIYWGARQIMIEVGALQPGDVVDYEIAKKVLLMRCLQPVMKTNHVLFRLCVGSFMILFPFGAILLLYVKFM